MVKMEYVIGKKLRVIIDIIVVNRLSAFKSLTKFDTNFCWVNSIHNIFSISCIILSFLFLYRIILKKFEASCKHVCSTRIHDCTIKIIRNFRSNSKYKFNIFCSKFYIMTVRNKLTLKKLLLP